MNSCTKVFYFEITNGNRAFLWTGVLNMTCRKKEAVLSQPKCEAGCAAQRRLWLASCICARSCFYVHQGRRDESNAPPISVLLCFLGAPPRSFMSARSAERSFICMKNWSRVEIDMLTIASLPHWREKESFFSVSAHIFGTPSRNKRGQHSSVEIRS